MRRYFELLLLIPIGLAAGLAVGCANLCVKRVPLEERAAGCDHKHCGFRYYLTRPYILVKKQIPVAEVAIATEAFVLKANVDAGSLQSRLRKDAIVLKSIEAEREPRYFLADGTEILDPEARTLLGANLEPVQIGRANRSGVQLVRNDEVTGILSPNAGAALEQTAKEVDIEVVNLPDLEEQYAVKNVNVLAKSEYNLSFTEASTLAVASGSFDSTDIPVQLITLAKNMVNKSLGLQKGRIDAAIQKLGGAALDASVTQRIFFVCRRESIEPGLYRVQKSWERLAAAPGMGADQCRGLFTEMGFSIQVETRVLSYNAYYDIKAPTPPG